MNRGFECFLGPRSRDLFDDCLWIIFRSFQRDPREINEERPAPFLSTGNAGLVLFFMIIVIVIIVLVLLVLFLFDSFSCSPTFISWSVHVEACG